MIYDITVNKRRSLISKRCKQAGLYRVQKSVFLGSLDPGDIDVLALQCEEGIVKEEDSVYIFPFCDADFKKIRLFGQAFDKKLVNDEVKALFV